MFAINHLFVHRCLFLLALPQFFSKRGRTMLIAYVFVITLSGPVANTTRNTEVVMQSLSCDQVSEAYYFECCNSSVILHSITQKTLGSIAKQIYTIIKQPLVAIKHVVERILKHMKQLFVKLRDIMIRMNAAIVRIVQVIKRAFAFLARAANVCNKDIGTPFERCIEQFNVAHHNCLAKFDNFPTLCDVTKPIRMICYSVKFIDYVCEFVEYVSDETLDILMQNLARIERDIHDLMYVSVSFEHHFHFETNASKSYQQIRDEIVLEVSDRAKALFVVMTFVHLVSSVLFTWVVLK